MGESTLPFSFFLLFYASNLLANLYFLVEVLKLLFGLLLEALLILVNELPCLLSDLAQGLFFVDRLSVQQGHFALFVESGLYLPFGVKLLQLTRISQ